VLLEHGVNHIDVAASYGDAELRDRHVAAAPSRHVLRGHEDRERTYRAAREEIRRSLDRLGVDRSTRSSCTTSSTSSSGRPRSSADGALEAAIEAREEGLVRFIGVTGHGLSVPEMHRRSLERFPFDSVLLPYNYVQMQDPRYAETFEALAAVCAERNVALQTIKSLARRRWDGREPPRRPGTSRCASRRTSTWRCTGCSAGRRRSCSPPATWRSCRGCWTGGTLRARARRRRRWRRSSTAGTQPRCSSSLPSPIGVVLP
jgi:aryl-alcohol dehydrogenase-like predicted oxidoreductase